MFILRSRRTRSSFTSTVRVDKFYFRSQTQWTNENINSDQPTYYHMHIHITNVHTEPTGGQAIGKAITVEDVISRLESLPEGKGMADISMTYVIGESSELWTDIFNA